MTFTAEGVRADLAAALATADALLDGVAGVEGARTVANTLVPFDRAEAIAASAYGTGPFLGQVHTDEDVRAAGQEAEAELGRWRTSVVFRRDLYEALEAFASTDEARDLTGEDARYLERLRRDFRRAGHALPPEAREEVREHEDALTDLGVRFQANIAAHDDGLELTREELAGMPDEWIARLQPGADPDTYRVSLDYPDYLPFMDQAERRDLREELSFRFANRARETNTPVLEEAVRRRARVAELFGEASWADHQTAVKMAGSHAQVEVFHADLLPPLRAKAQEELADLREAMDADDEVRRWDLRSLHTRIKRERFGIDPNEVASYFPLHRVLEGLFDITQAVFGLSYERVEDVRTWHEDVTTYAVRDAASDELIGHFLLDLHPRKGKFGHAAVFPLRPAHRAEDGHAVTPVCAMVCNFTAPGTDEPSLLQHSEVVTLFHEFGHVLHDLLGRARYARFSGVAVERDFVEAPSQIMEHWCWDAPVLARFARHHATDEVIPTGLVEQLVAARDLHVALFTLRQIELALVDLTFHGPNPPDDLVAATDEVAAEVGYLPPQQGTFFPAGWGHLFGYDAGYYGYLWAKVYGDDMFSRFEEQGALDPGVGMAYRREVLAPGGARDAEELLRAFLGREPNRDAFLRHVGIAPRD